MTGPTETLEQNQLTAKAK